MPTAETERLTLIFDATPVRGASGAYLQKLPSPDHPLGLWCFSADRALAFETWSDAEAVRQGLISHTPRAEVRKVTVNVRYY